MVAAIVVLFHVLGVVSSINAVMTARTAQGAIAWGVSLVTFPYIAVPAYWVLGRRNFEGYRKAWIDRHDEVKQFEATMGERLEPFACPRPLPVHTHIQQSSSDQRLRVASGGNGRIR